MLKISIYKDSVLTNEATFSTEEELQSFIAKHEEMGTFQLSEKTVTTTGFDGVETVEVVPATHTFVVTDISAEVEQAAAKAAKIAAGKRDREKCQLVLDFIAGSNRDKELTFEQISDMQTIFASAEKALRSSRPDFATMFISAIVPDGTLVTEEEKAECLSILAGN